MYTHTETCCLAHAGRDFTTTMLQHNTILPTSSSKRILPHPPTTPSLIHVTTSNTCSLPAAVHLPPPRTLSHKKKQEWVLRRAWEGPRVWEGPRAWVWAPPREWEARRRAWAGEVPRVGRRRAWVVAGRPLDTEEGLLVNSPPPSFTRQSSPPGPCICICRQLGCSDMALYYLVTTA